MSLKSCSDGDAVELELNSRVISVSAARGAEELQPGSGQLEVQLELARRPDAPSGRQWNATCAAARGLTWNLDSPCHVVPPMAHNVTHCRCVGPGTFAALLTMHAPTVSGAPSPRE